MSEPQESDLLNIFLNKRIFISPSENDLETLKKAIRKRVENGQGEAFIQLGMGEFIDPGLTKEEMDSSAATLESITSELNFTSIYLRDVTSSSLKRVDINDKKKLKTDQKVETEVTTNDSLLVRDYLIRKKPEVEDFVDLRIAVVGNVDAGKSTLLGVLTHGLLDNGRGLARLKLFRHKHEIDSGRTSSIGNDILGFGPDGQIVNKPIHGHLDWQQICKNSAKVITFIDLAGHEKYLKTTVFGMTGHAPDFVMLIVGANAGIVGMTKEHLGLALALSVPVFVVVTKIDMCPGNVLQDTMNLLFKILKSPGCRKMPIHVQNKDDVILSATNFTSQRMCPVFTISNVTGENLDLVKQFLNLLTIRNGPQIDKPAEFQIDEVFNVPGVGTVVSGTCLSGVININDNMKLGPDPTGSFATLPIKSIHRKRMPVNKVCGGQTASFSLKKVRRNQIRKGMVLLHPSLEATSSIQFKAEVLILHHPTTIWVGYQAMVHAGTSRQTATIISIDGKDRLRTGDKDVVTFRFIKQPEYLKVGLRLVFREGKTKAVGTIIEVKNYDPKQDINPKQRPARRARRNKYDAQPSAPTTNDQAQTAATT